MPTRYHYRGLWMDDHGVQHQIDRTFCACGEILEERHPGCCDYVKKP